MFVVIYTSGSSKQYSNLIKRGKKKTLFSSVSCVWIFGRIPSMRRGWERNRVPLSRRLMFWILLAHFDTSCACVHTLSLYYFNTFFSSQKQFVKTPCWTDTNILFTRWSLCNTYIQVFMQNASRIKHSIKINRITFFNSKSTANRMCHRILSKLKCNRVFKQTHHLGGFLWFSFYCCCARFEDCVLKQAMH